MIYFYFFLVCCFFWYSDDVQHSTNNLCSEETGYEDDKGSIFTGRQNEGVACNETIRQQACMCFVNGAFLNWDWLKSSFHINISLCCLFEWKSSEFLFYTNEGEWGEEESFFDGHHHLDTHTKIKNDDDHWIKTDQKDIFVPKVANHQFFSKTN